MKRKFKFQTMLLTILSLIAAYMIYDLLYKQKEMRYQKAIDDKQKIIIPFQEIKERYGK